MCFYSYGYPLLARTQYLLGINCVSRFADGPTCSSVHFLPNPGLNRSESGSGRVDDDAVVSCQAKRCTSSPLAADEHFKFSKPLPSRDIEVRLEHSLGRGEIRLAEQPREKNNYTAQVAIRDPQAGSGEYTFTLVWDRNGAANLAPELPHPCGPISRIGGHHSPAKSPTTVPRSASR